MIANGGSQGGMQGVGGGGMEITSSSPAAPPTLPPTPPPVASQQAPEDEIRASLALSGISASEFSDYRVQKAFRVSVSNRMGVEERAVRITQFSRRSSTVVQFTVTMPPSRSQGSAERLESFLENDSNTGFQSSMNAALSNAGLSDVTVSSTAVVSAPEQ